MKQRLGYVLLLGLATGALAVSACGDDNSTIDNGGGGEAGASGSSAGTKTGGSASGGSSNKAGSGNGGEAGSGAAGTSPEGGAGGATDGGTGGAGDGGMGNSAGAAGSDAGAAGAGGAGPQLVYACGSDNLPQRLCSALFGAGCTDPTVCSDCETERTAELDDFLAAFPVDNQCAACLDKYNEYFQCAIDAFESANISSGIECIDGYGADISYDNCVPLQSEANACHTWLNEHPCPATWPPT